jgi:hypothetical protein
MIKKMTNDIILISSEYLLSILKKNRIHANATEKNIVERKIDATAYSSDELPNLIFLAKSKLIFQIFQSKLVKNFAKFILNRTFWFHLWEKNYISY